MLLTSLHPRLGHIATALLFSVSAALFAASPAQGEEARPSIGKYVKAYASHSGVKVWAVRYDARDKHQALVQVGGIDHDLDMRILLATTEVTDKDTRYIVTLNQKPFTLLVLQDGRGELYLPGESRPRPVGYSDALSEQTNPEHFLSAYQAQGAAR